MYMQSCSLTYCQVICNYSGSSVSLSLDGHRLAVGGPFDSGGVGAMWIFLSNGMTYQPLGFKLVGSGGASDETTRGKIPEFVPSLIHIYINMRSDTD